MNKITLIDQILYTLQNLITSIFLISFSKDNKILAELTTLVLIFSLNSTFVNATYSELLARYFNDNIKSKRDDSLDCCDILIIPIIINIIILAFTFFAGIIAINDILIFIPIAVAVPFAEALRQSFLYFIDPIKGFKIDILQIIFQLLMYCTFFVFGKIDSYVIFAGWILPTFFLGFFNFIVYFKDKLRNKKGLMLFFSKKLHFSAIEFLLASIQIWLLSVLFGKFFGNEEVAYLQVGVLLAKPINFIGILFKSTKYFPLYSSPKEELSREILIIKRNYNLVSLLIVIFVLFTPDEIMSNFSKGLQWQQVKYVAVLLIIRIGITQHYSDLYLRLKFENKNLPLLIFRILETTGLVLIVTIASLFYNVYIVLILSNASTLLHKYLIWKFLTQNNQK